MELYTIILCSAVREFWRFFVFICLEMCTKHIPVRTNKSAKTKSKVEKYRLSLFKMRRKRTKRLTKCTSQTKKAKITHKLLQIERNLQKSFNDSRRYMENKAINSIREIQSNSSLMQKSSRK